MGFLSFFKPHKRTNSSAQVRQRAAFRESTADAEQRLRQRARWRLLGASLLVVISVAFLPKLLDIAPQPVTAVAEIKIRQQHTNAASIPSTVATEPSSPLSISRPSVNLSSAKPADSSSGSKVEREDERGATRQYKQYGEEPRSEVENRVSEEANVSEANVKQSGRNYKVIRMKRNWNEMALSEGEEIVRQHTKAAAPEILPTGKDSEPVSQANQVSGKFFLKAGAFASETRAYNWLAKLKAAKLPAHVYHKKMTEGERYLVRVGPFTDHSSAQVAQKKLQNMGLPSIITEGMQP